jgi:hypothetical protein
MRGNGHGRLDVPGIRSRKATIGARSQVDNSGTVERESDGSLIRPSGLGKSGMEGEIPSRDGGEEIQIIRHNDAGPVRIEELPPLYQDIKSLREEGSR